MKVDKVQSTGNFMDLGKERILALALKIICRCEKATQKGSKHTCVKNRSSANCKQFLHRMCNSNCEIHEHQQSKRQIRRWVVKTFWYFSTQDNFSTNILKRIRAMMSRWGRMLGHLSSFALFYFEVTQSSANFVGVVS